MIWTLVLSGFGCLIFLGWTSHFTGRLAEKVRLYILAAGGGCLLLASALLFFQEPWSGYVDPRAGGRHAWVGFIMNAIFAIGPQLTGCILAVLALYMLRGARDIHTLSKRL